uniref:Uncharacterized protein n=1 Tax=Onchocerca volvulus TaxID=6282 RepID=A0A8R1XY48_ONCVO
MFLGENMKSLDYWFGVSLFGLKNVNEVVNKPTLSFGSCFSYDNFHLVAASHMITLWIIGLKFYYLVEKVRNGSIEVNVAVVSLASQSSLQPEKNAI